MHGHIEVWRMIIETERELHMVRMRRNPHQPLGPDLSIRAVLSGWVRRLRGGRPLAVAMAAVPETRGRTRCPLPVRAHPVGCGCTLSERRRRYGACTAGMRFRSRRLTRCE